MTSPILGLLHPGQMGAAVAAQARRNGVTVLWCRDGRSPPAQRRGPGLALGAGVARRRPDPDRPRPAADLAAGAAAVLDHWTPDKDDDSLTVAEVLDHLGS